MSNHEHEYGACPHCNCARLERRHRGFIRKYIFRMQPLFECIHCQKRFSKSKVKFISTLKKDIEKEH